ncbi:hypothetical protein B2J86_03605 [Acidovorax sp. SRB_14]|uniref:hypothetical protein n=1 Tax=unclassified Acidovorax TaxID=2684926 RepID=UPI00145D75C7|nr:MULTISPECIES: hypothetical protein [unclassified Acidovorax]NMM75612.1 hypothetical protein [Acidovorax sp. SRB_24]NMM76840.1 hypothetical protein [Acidovorax sp. SRB_24]NMM80023.1 hypothetical protein [Acidovorax sp. SRB_14]NMM86238.1 hypothetical protein [Rhodococcus sp. SRB_17]
MATQSPFSFLGSVFERLAAGPQPPEWLAHEVQHRAVLFLNHVLMQERAATERLARQSGRVARLQWRGYSMALQVTPAGLFDLAPPTQEPHLRLEATQTSPLDLAQSALRGDKPAVRIEGDVQLAADLQWLADNVRWDAEEDLARLVGDVPAHMLAGMARRSVEALRQFVGARIALAPAPASHPAAAPAADSGDRAAP